MFKYPMTFSANVSATNGTKSPWPINSQEHKASCAIPPEFGGPGGAFSPEDLFAQALSNCFVATFKVYAEASKVSYDEINTAAELIVDLNEQKRPIMKKLILGVDIVGASNEGRVKAVAEKAFASGFILNSVKTELELDLQFRGSLNS